MAKHKRIYFASLWRFTACIALILGAVTMTAQAQSPEASRLTVRVTGVRSVDGQVMVSLHNEAPGFGTDSTKAFRIQRVKIESGSAEVVFDDLPQGIYAVSAFHDENSNGKLDKNFMGIPKEGYGASNNPKKRRGPPPFDEAKFSLNQPEQTVEFKLMY